jgi:hypothetical protein
MEFNIMKGATLPVLKMELINDGRYDFKNFFDKLQNSIIKFNMWEVTTGKHVIGNRLAGTELVTPISDCCEEYFITYNFRAIDTKNVGRYVGQFSIEVLDGSGTLLTPISEELFINVIGGSIKK